MYPKNLRDIIELLQKLLPGVGQRQARRYTFSLLQKDSEGVTRLGKLLVSLHESVKPCVQCFRLIEQEKRLCDICSNPKRNQQIITVVEKQSDIEAIEKVGQFHGTYHVINGLIPFFEKEFPSSRLHIDELYKRIENKNVKEVILALSTTPEGEATSLYISKILSPAKIKITKLGQGLSGGSEIEYADPETLRASLENRRDL